LGFEIGDLGFELRDLGGVKLVKLGDLLDFFRGRFEFFQREDQAVNGFFFFE